MYCFLSANNSENPCKSYETTENMFYKSNLYLGESKVLRCVSLWHVYHGTKAVPTVENNIVVSGVLICYALFHSMCNLRATQMNVQYNLIWELMLYKFEMSHNSVEATKNIYCMKGEGTVNYRIKKFCSDCDSERELSHENEGLLCSCRKRAKLCLA